MLKFVVYCCDSQEIKLHADTTYHPKNKNTRMRNNSTSTHYITSSLLYITYTLQSYFKFFLEQTPAWKYFLLEES